mmetsp:Transcript_23172/g.38127  ORF Transcript_23172/g.38127 Transcript_23172/m.38127 type:complete len:221 (+) Transcript_23172:194-856(+)
MAFIVPTFPTFTSSSNRFPTFTLTCSSAKSPVAANEAPLSKQRTLLDNEIKLWEFRISRLSRDLTVVDNVDAMLSQDLVKLRLKRELEVAERAKEGLLKRKTYPSVLDGDLKTIAKKINNLKTTLDFAKRYNTGDAEILEKKLLSLEKQKLEFQMSLEEARKTYPDNKEEKFTVVDQAEKWKSWSKIQKRPTASPQHNVHWIHSVRVCTIDDPYGKFFYY